MIIETLQGKLVVIIDRFLSCVDSLLVWVVPSNGGARTGKDNLKLINSYIEYFESLTVLSGRV